MTNKKRLIIGILGEPKYDEVEFEMVSMYDGYKKIIISRNAIPFMIPSIHNINYLETKLSDIPELNSYCDYSMIPNTLEELGIEIKTGR